MPTLPKYKHVDEDLRHLIYPRIYDISHGRSVVQVWPTEPYVWNQPFPLLWKCNHTDPLLAAILVGRYAPPSAANIMHYNSLHRYLLR